MSVLSQSPPARAAGIIPLWFPQLERDGHALEAGHVFSPANRIYTEVEVSLANEDYWPTFPASWSGDVRITSSRPVIAVGRLHLRSEVMTCNGFGVRGMKMYVLMLFKNAYNGYNAAINIQNTDILGSAGQQRLLAALGRLPA